ncbi:MAG: succinate--CoA ligase subunit alpha [Thermoplasmata archaeon]|nr:succinate--CoA ligase subunit alpha [Thermoplasmata archaeon]
MVFINKNTKVIVQGITGHQGAFHANEMVKFGTNVVAGISPGKAGQNVNGIPVFDSVEETLHLEPNATMISVPAPYVKDAFYEALDAGIKLIYVLTEHVPVHDSLEMISVAKTKGVIVIGPNGPGITVPFDSKIGIMPNHIFRKGNVAVISRSGTLTYEIVKAITDSGMGESTVIGLGGDAIVGLSFTDVLKELKNERRTKAAVLVGEIGGTAEEEAAEYIKSEFHKPVVAYIAGRSAPPGKRMGHAGAIITRGKGTAESKIKALNEAGVEVAAYPQDIPSLLKKKLQ